MNNRNPVPIIQPGYFYERINVNIIDGINDLRLNDDGM